jgi:hypothetical protein
MSTDATRPYENAVDMKTKQEVLQQDRAAGTYFEHARSNAEVELSGRFRHLAKEQIVTGSVPFVHVPGQPATSHWGAGTRLPDELPLGIDVNAVADTETLDGKPRAKPDTGKV